MSNKRRTNRAFQHTNNIFNTDDEENRRSDMLTTVQSTYVQPDVVQSTKEDDRIIRNLPPRLKRRVLEAIESERRSAVNSRENLRYEQERDSRFDGANNRFQELEIAGVQKDLAYMPPVTAYTQGHIRDRVTKQYKS